MSVGRSRASARLQEYREKRRFADTPEPFGQSRRRAAGRRLRYVIQKHQARRLHYDFRLEWRGILLSWAVPKGPSLDPSTRRLAMRVEDHPVDYARFEGTIPEGEYGAGTVMVWDAGTWRPEDPDVDGALRRGDLKFTLHGKKLKGSWVLVRTRGFPRGSSARRETWLLIKHRDRFAARGDADTGTARSAISNRTLDEIANAAEGSGRAGAAARPRSG